MHLGAGEAQEGAEAFGGFPHPPSHRRPPDGDAPHEAEFDGDVAEDPLDLEDVLHRERW